ncbi:MAG: (Fe-S)-binding protein [Candidatus Helarchaeota archaeon]|nr:(Fe-S)-binding protein [Candidatus Helarchaeota archaeon]
MSLKDLKDWLYRCPKCNSCKYVYKDYSKSCPSGEKFRWETYWGSGRVWMAYALKNGELEWSDSITKAIFACPTCGSCAEQCEQEVKDHLIDIYEALRAEAVKSGYGPMPEQKIYAKFAAEKHNPYNEPHETRSSWMKNPITMKDNAEILYFVGCTSSYREKEIANATLEILKKLNLDFTVSKDEWCCGSPLLRTGQIDDAKNLIEHNIELFKKMGIKRIITSCAGCFRTLNKDYPDLKDLGIEIQHISDFLLEKMKDSSLKEMNVKVTYHDPCHIGRHSGLFDSPRQVIQSIPGIDLVEMKRIRENAWCCGAGGGVKSAFKDWAVEIATERIKEAEETGADILLSSCPFCRRNLNDAIKKSGSNIKMMDIVEFLQDRI